MHDSHDYQEGGMTVGDKIRKELSDIKKQLLIISKLNQAQTSDEIRTALIEIEQLSEPTK